MKKSILLLLVVSIFGCLNSSTDQTSATVGVSQILPDSFLVIKGTDAPDIISSFSDFDSASEGNEQTVPEDVQTENSQPEFDTQETDPEVEPKDVVPECIDNDGDNFGENCQLGDDCDDTNPNFAVFCPDCKKPNYPGCPCDNAPVSCYSYDPATMGVGICKAGNQICQSGYWQSCSGEVFPVQEVCDGKDNDCDGKTDEGVKSSCGGCDLTCTQMTVGDVGNPIALNSENSSGVGLDQQGQIVIDSKQISLNLKFIWIANSPQNTVSKVDCKTIQEVGRYPVCSDPSRTSVDLEGNVWVACRGDGQVAKIMAEKKNCIDKNSNGAIETSTGSQVVPGDECVKFIVQPGKGTYARGAAVDKYNNVWIGYWNSKTMVQLSAKDGATLKDVNLGCSPYGLVIDQKGLIWGQGAGCNSLILYNPDTGQVFTSSNMPNLKYPSGAYGLNVDPFGRIWVASSNTASVYTPATGVWQVINMGWGGGRGVATSNDGFVYVAVDSSGGAVKINGVANPPQVVGFIKGAGNPVGAALDYDGFVWVVNQSGSSATKMDPKNMAAIGTVSVGSSPYTYSDMTGYTLNYFTAPKGQYSTAFFATGLGNPVSQVKPKAVWQKFHMEAFFPPATKVAVKYRAADDKNTLENLPWQQMPDFTDMSQLPFDLTKNPVVGLILQVEINLITEDKKVSPAVKFLSAKAKLL